MSMIENNRRVACWAFIALVGSFTVGCADVPTQPDSGEGELGISANGDAVMAEVESSLDLLPSLEGVQLMAYESLDGSIEAPGAEEKLFEAGALEVESEVAAGGGDTATSATLADWADAAVFEASATVVGLAGASTMISNLEEVARRIEAAAMTGARSPRVEAAIRHARENATRARQAVNGGDMAAGLGLVLEASDDLRALNPEARARDIIQKAFRLLERATELAGPDPRPEIAALLRRATEHCEAASRALDAGLWAVAVREAKLCAKAAGKVIRLLSGGIDDDALAKRAQASVDQAISIYQRAVEVAGDSPPEEIVRALGRAREYLEAARESLREENWREAIRLARESAAISKRVIGFFSHDRPTDRLQERAEHAVEQAKSLLQRADGLVGPDSRPEILELLGRARNLIGQADAALTNEDWREAIAKAEQAALILQRVLRLLS